MPEEPEDASLVLMTLPVVALYDAPEPDVVLEERISDASVAAAAKPELPELLPEEPAEEPPPEIPVDESAPAEGFSPEAPADALPVPAEEPPPVEDPDDELPAPVEEPVDELPVPDEDPDDELPDPEDVLPDPELELPEEAGIVTSIAAVTVPSSAGVTAVALSQEILESVVSTLFPLSANAYPSEGVSVT